MAPGGAEATVSPGRPGQRGGLVELHLLHPLDHKLRDPVPAPEADRLQAIRVEQRDLYLPAIAGVHRPRGVHDGDPVAGGQPRARMHERRVTGGQRDGDAGRDQGTLPRRQVHVLSRAQIRAGIARMSEGGQRETWVQALDEHVDRDAGTVGGSVHGHHSSNGRPGHGTASGTQHDAASSSRPVTLSRSRSG
jgi:hypothetical protein